VPGLVVSAARLAPPPATPYHGVMLPLVCLFTDFGAEGPYLAQMEAAILTRAPQARVLNLLSDAPAADPLHGAYLLAALMEALPADAVVVAVVDPGVGGERLPLVVEAGGRRCVGPDNGLLSQWLRRHPDAGVWRIDWRPARLSASFHGRDLFAPVAARLLLGDRRGLSPLAPAGLVGADWSADLQEVIYLDHFGNAFTGIRAEALAGEALLEVAGHRLPRARTFSEVPPGTAFWYANSCGLVEIAVNAGRAADRLGLVPGTPVAIHPPGEG